MKRKGYNPKEEEVSSILAILVLISAPAFKELVTTHRLAAGANQVLGMVFTARAEGAYRSNMLICSDLGQCDAFEEPDRRLILIADHNGNNTLDNDDDLISSLTFPAGMTVQWRSFRRLPSLQINRHGVAYYQNGHFLLCYRGQARKVILNFQAKARVSKSTNSRHCPSSE